MPFYTVSSIIGQEDSMPSDLTSSEGFIPTLGANFAKNPSNVWIPLSLDALGNLKTTSATGAGGGQDVNILSGNSTDLANVDSNKALEVAIIGES